MANEIKYTTITWEEYCRLQRRSEILDWIDGDFMARKPGPPLSELVGQMIDSGESLKQTIDRFAANSRPRRARRPSEGETAPRSQAEPSRL